MRRVAFVLVLVAGVALSLSLPVAAQRIPPRVRTHSSGARVGNITQHVFVPNFGLRPVIRERFPVSGLGFDAHHFHRVHGFHRRLGFRRGRFFFNGGFGFSSLHHSPFLHHTPFLHSTPSVIVVPQAVPVQVPVIIQTQNRESNRAAERPVAVPVGLPWNWNQLRIERPSYAEQPRPLSQLTLLVLKDETILAATDYWLEGDRIFYLTSSRRQGSLALADLDWEMTRKLNAERHVLFVLRATR